LSIDVVPLWQIATFLITMAAGVLFVSAIWPPLHLRRLLTASTFVMAAIGTMALNYMPSLRLPMQVVILAECTVLRETAFRDALELLAEEPAILKDAKLYVFGSVNGETCDVSLPEYRGILLERLTEFADRSRAFAIATHWLEAEGNHRHWSAWPRSIVNRPRIVIAHAPGGPLEPDSNVEEPSRLNDERVPVIYHEPYGVSRVSIMRLNVAPAHVGFEDFSRSFVLEIADERLAGAKSAKLDFTFGVAKNGLSGDCEIGVSSDKSEFVLPEGGGKFEIKSYSDKVQAAAVFEPHLSSTTTGEGSLSFLTLYAKGGFDPICHGELESSVSLGIDVEIELTSGTRIGDRRVIMLPVISTPGLTLVTPDPADYLENHIVGPGWEHDAAAPGYGLDGSPGFSDVFSPLIDELAPDACRSVTGCVAVSNYLLQRTAACHFAGLAAVTSDPHKFEACLERTRRLAVLGINGAELKALDLVTAKTIEERIRLGELDVLVGAPVHLPGTSSLPNWVPPIENTPELRTEVQLDLRLSPQVALRMTAPGRSSGWAVQKAFLDEMVDAEVLGPATESLSSSGSMLQSVCVPGERFTGESNMAWWRDVGRSNRAPDMTTLRPANRRHPEPRLKAVVHQELPPLKSAIGRDKGQYLERLVCHGPIVRLEKALRDQNSKLPNPVETPRATIVLFADDDLHPYLSAVTRVTCGSTAPFNQSDFIANLKKFTSSGGRIVVLPVVDAKGLTTDIAAVKSWTGSKPIPLSTLVSSLNSASGVTDGIVMLNAKILNRDPTHEVVAALTEFLNTNWTNDLRLSSAFTGDGSLIARHAICAIEPVIGAIVGRSGEGCATASGSTITGPLDRRAPTPERSRRLVKTDDPFVTARWRLCTGEEIAWSRPHGLGRVTALGFSPFARDLLSPDMSKLIGISSAQLSSLAPLSLEPAQALLRRGQCYLQADGRRADTRPFFNPFELHESRSVPANERGGLKLLARFQQLSEIDRPLGMPRITAIATDPDSGELTIEATADLAARWVWSPKATFRGESVDVRFSGVNRKTGAAKFSVYKPVTAEGLLRLSLAEKINETGHREPISVTLIPTFFVAPNISAQATTLVEKKFYLADALGFDKRTLAVAAMLAATLLMFSPVARRWKVAEMLVRIAILGRRQTSVFERVARAAPLFSLEAGLTEWGIHPGEPEATRSFGLPAGLRRWRSGDQGGAIRWATLYPMIAKSKNLPPQLPDVNLRTASEAVDTLVLVEGNGALLTPEPRRAPGKTDFAARFGSFLSHAVQLSHGRAEIIRIGEEPLESLEPEDTERALCEAIARPSVPISPAEALIGQNAAGRLVFYICDGLSINLKHLTALADQLSVEGSLLRVAAIISEDDLDNIGLRRDPFDGAFDDDSETPPLTILERRNDKLTAAIQKLERRQATLVVLDTALTAQELLNKMTESDFLR
jgi:hypothetical protein